MGGISGIVLLHAAVSLIAILSGFAVLIGLARGAQDPRGTRTFLATAIATSITGLLIPVDTVAGTRPAAMIALVVLGLMLIAQYVFAGRGVWRAIYVIGLLASMALLIFAGIAQLFLKFPPLYAMAPKLNEPVFIAAEIAGLLVFVAFGVAILRASRRDAAAP